MSQGQEKGKKPKVTAFIPLGQCTCMYSHYMDRVTEIILPYRSVIEFEVKGTDSPEADKYDLLQMAVVIEGHPKFEKPIIIKNINQLASYLKEIENK